MVIYVQAAADARTRAFRLLGNRSFLPSPSSYSYNVLYAYEKRCHLGYKMAFLIEGFSVAEFPSLL